MNSIVETQLDERARDFIRSSVEHGVSVQALLDGQGGSYSRGESCQIGGYFDSTCGIRDLVLLMQGKRKLIKLERGQMAVKIGDQYKIYWVHKVYTELLLGA